MTQRERDDVYIEHMLECIARIEEYVEGNRGKFLASRMVQDAVIRNLQTLAESSQRLSSALRDTRPEIDWRAIAGFRNVLVHDYLGLDLHAVWLVIEQDLPQLKRALVAMANSA